MAFGPEPEIPPPPPPEPPLPPPERITLVELGDARVGAGMGAEVAERILRRHTNEVRYCYEHELEAAPDLSGWLELEVAVGGTGAVSSAAIGTNELRRATPPEVDEHVQNVETCLVALAERITFPAPDGTTASFTQPITFGTRLETEDEIRYRVGRPSRVGGEGGS